MLLSDTSLILTSLSWVMDDVPLSDGVFGFTIFGFMGRSPSYVSKDGSVYVDGAVTKIRFYTNNDDGLHIRVQLYELDGLNGRSVNFICEDCRSDSVSLLLGRLYVDQKEMDEQLDLPESALCEDSCTFVRGTIFHLIHDLAGRQWDIT